MAKGWRWTEVIEDSVKEMGVVGLTLAENWCAEATVKYAERQERQSAKPPRIARPGSLGG